MLISKARSKGTVRPKGNCDSFERILSGSGIKVLSRWLTCMSVCLVLVACGESEPDIVESHVIKVATLQPLAGDCAQWGIPITRGIEMWADELNAEGGILVGDGNRYQLTVKAYDNACYNPGEELKAARRAILDYGAEFMLQTFTPASRQDDRQFGHREWRTDDIIRCRVFER